MNIHIEIVYSENIQIITLNSVNIQIKTVNSVNIHYKHNVIIFTIIEPLNLNTICNHCDVIIKFTQK